jgi:hypothetical protein
MAVAPSSIDYDIQRVIEKKSQDKRQMMPSPNGVVKTPLRATLVWPIAGT